MKINKDIFREVLLEQGLTQKEAAEKSGVSSVSIKKALEGMDLSLKVISKIAKGLEIAPSSLIAVGSKDDKAE